MGLFKTLLGKHGKGGIGAWFKNTKHSIADGLDKAKNNVTGMWHKSTSWWAAHGKPVMDKIQEGANTASKLAKNKIVRGVGEAGGAAIGSLVGDPEAGAAIAKKALNAAAKTGEAVKSARKLGASVAGGVGKAVNALDAGNPKKAYKNIKKAYMGSKGLIATRDLSATPKGPSLPGKDSTKAAMVGGTANPQTGVEKTKAAFNV